MNATVSVKVGPIKARFQGRVELSNIDPPFGYTIMGEGSGGSAGAAKGGADVTLLEDDGATILRQIRRSRRRGRRARRRRLPQSIGRDPGSTMGDHRRGSPLCHAATGFAPEVERVTAGIDGGGDAPHA